jgi:hypothetical protein
MLEVVVEVCGLHAQLLSSAELTLWTRVEEIEPEAVERALWEERTLVKSWAMQGTLHLLPAAEFPLWQAALSTYRHYLKPVWLRAFGITREELERLVAAVSQVLDGRMLTREELASEVTRLTGSTELGGKLRESWGAMLKPAAFQGSSALPLISARTFASRGPIGGWAPYRRRTRAMQCSKSRAVTWLPTGPRRARTTAAGGPWSHPAPRHKSRPWARKSAKSRSSGPGAWMLTRHMREAAEASPPGSVRLLPAFDQYVIGASRVSSNYFPGPCKDRVYRAQGWVSPVLLVDGRMDGIWRYERKGSRLAVEIEPFVELPGWARRAAEAEAERLARLHGRSPQADLAILALGTPMSHRGRACQGPYSTYGKALEIPNPARYFDRATTRQSHGRGCPAPRLDDRPPYPRSSCYVKSELPS